jgi:hypothetical protein
MHFPGGVVQDETEAFISTINARLDSGTPMAFFQG